ncbi:MULTISPECIES: peptidoglycan-binding protein [unclassified Streptomyces]|uniref:peptidoglycan-binding domain-containing protein n=1 Tax=unclassified Streptomyces TaxID=2593676 RepID=UPI00336A22DD
MTADLCPHCFAPARENGRPGCACAARAAAAAAAAGDSEDRMRDDRDGIRGRDGMRDSTREDRRDGFDDEIRDDPMGPRPYVTLAGEDRRKGPELRDIRLFERMTPRRSAHEDRDAHDVDAELERPGRERAGRADEADDAAGGAAAGTGRGNRAAGAAAVTQAFEPVTQPIDRIGSIEPARAGADAPVPAEGGAASGTGRHRKSRRGPVVAVLSGAAAVAVAGTLAFGTGLLGGDKKHDQEADRTLSDPSSSAPDDDPSAKDDETPGKPSPSASSATPTATPSASKKESASPRPSRSPSTLKSEEPAKTAAPPTPSATGATGSVTPSPTETPTPTGPPVLQEGDSGSEVVELQKRLGQLLLYLGPSDGDYDDAVRNAVTSFQNTYGVEGDPKGVYGPNTRRALESRTDEP